ncbi:MAG: DNA double-strand break repair nuclease NurA, partial [Vulcanisaeta sp.]
MFNEVIINMLELIETRIAQIRDRAIDLFNEAHNYLDYVMRIPQVRTSLRFAAVDSGFTEIPYLGFRVSVINVAILVNIDGKGRVMTMFEPILGIAGDELERIALNMEVKYALDVIRR